MVQLCSNGLKRVSMLGKWDGKSRIFSNYTRIITTEYLVRKMIKERIQQKGERLKMLQGHDRLVTLIDIAKDVLQLFKMKLKQKQIEYEVVLVTCG